MNVETPHLQTDPASEPRPHLILTVCLRTLHLLALALWLGGLVAIGALVAPTAFHTLRSAPALAGNIPLQNTLAGGIVGGSLHFFNFLDLACAAVLLAVNVLLLPHTSRLWTYTCLGTALLLLVSVLFLAFGLTPAMDHAQASGEMAAFDQMHRLYEQVSTLLQLPLLLLLTLSTALRDTRRS